MFFGGIIDADSSENNEWQDGSSCAWTLKQLGGDVNSKIS